MGNAPSIRDKQIKAQEEYVNQRMQDSDIKQLSQMRGGFFHREDPKYNVYQLKSYLGQEYNRTRNRNDYVLDRDLTEVGTTSRRRTDRF